MNGSPSLGEQAVSINTGKDMEVSQWRSANPAGLAASGSRVTPGGYRGSSPMRGRLWPRQLLDMMAARPPVKVVRHASETRVKSPGPESLAGVGVKK